MTDEILQYVGAPTDQLPTPCLLLDYALLTRNLRTMQDDLNGRSKQLRAHAKTHKPK